MLTTMFKVKYINHTTETVELYNIANFIIKYVSRRCSSRHKTACFKVTTKPYNVATRTPELGLVRTVQNSQRSKACNSVPLI